MATNVDLQDQLNRLLDLAHHQVHFAEAKNGALLTLNFAVILGMVAVFGNDFAWQWALYMIVVGTSLGIAGLVSVTSFLPRLTPINDISRAPHGNVAFTGAIAAMGASGFLLELRAKMLVTEPSSPYCVDLADQAYVNARIAETKFRRFRQATYLTVAGMIIPSFWIAQQVIAGSLKLWS
jgi:hypothetical protein